MKAFVNVKVKSGTPLSTALGERYHVRAYPTLLFLDADATEIDRIVGYGGVEGFTTEVERIRRGEGTLKALRAKHEAALDDVAAALAYAEKLGEADPKAAVVLLERTAGALAGKDRETETGAWVALAEAAARSGDLEKALATYERVLDERADTKAARGAVSGVYLFFRRGADPDQGLVFLAKARKALGVDVAGAADDAAVALHRRAAEAALRRQAERAEGDPQVLNAVAWTAYESRLALRDAVGWAREAVEKSKREPAILDTLAHLLFETGEVAEAAKVEKEALAAVEDASMKTEFEEALARFEAVARLRAKRDAAPVAEETEAAEAPK
jgi:tetratricopeptide (TPR) repeat protein